MPWAWLLDKELCEVPFSAPDRRGVPMLRLWFWPILFLAAALLPGAAVPAPAAAQTRIVAVGDLHGDHDAWRAIAAAAGVMDQQGHWSGGKTTLVQMGDIVDRGPQSLQIIQDLMRLQREAGRSGGRVIVLVGNHEAMMMTGDMRYVTPGELAAFTDRKSAQRRRQTYAANQAKIEAAYRAKFPDMPAKAIRDAWMETMPPGMLEYQAAWAPDGNLGRWELQNPAVLRLGDTLFVHGGISAAYAAIPIPEINRRVTDALKARDSSPTSIINDPHGPLWYRGLVTRSGSDETTVAPASANATAPALTIDQEIDLVLKSQEVKRIVVAHTPSLSGIVSATGGRLWRVDSGNSRAYGGSPSYLEIVGDRVTAHPVQRPAGPSWGAAR